jgi:hypothetical protein
MVQSNKVYPPGNKVAGLTSLGRTADKRYLLSSTMPRTAIPNLIRVAVLTEAGYRCAVPTCRTILAIDMHHLLPVSEGGGNTTANLIALCPTCHALFHRGEISRDSIYTWKSLLVSFSLAFDQRDIDDLLFLDTPQPYSLEVSGDGVVKFSRLIGAGLARTA